VEFAGSGFGRAYLEHLDERDGEVQVGHVTANERQREHDTDGDNSAQVDLASHGNLLARVEDAGEASEALGHQGRKAQMPCGEDDGCSKLLAPNVLLPAVSREECVRYLKSRV
jgi:hypothetical protein